MAGRARPRSLRRQRRSPPSRRGGLRLPGQGGARGASRAGCEPPSSHGGGGAGIRAAAGPRRRRRIAAPPDRRREPRRAAGGRGVERGEGRAGGARPPPRSTAHSFGRRRTRDRGRGRVSFSLRGGGERGPREMAKRRSLRLGPAHRARRGDPGAARGRTTGHPLLLPAAAHAGGGTAAGIRRQGPHRTRGIAPAGPAPLGGGAARDGYRRRGARGRACLRNSRPASRGAASPRSLGGSLVGQRAGEGTEPARRPGDRGDEVSLDGRRRGRCGPPAGGCAIHRRLRHDVETRVLASAPRAAETLARIPAAAPGLPRPGERSLPPRGREPPAAQDGRAHLRAALRGGKAPGQALGASRRPARRADRPRRGGRPTGARAVAALRPLGGCSSRAQGSWPSSVSGCSAEAVASTEATPQASALAAIKRSR